MRSLLRAERHGPVLRLVMCDEASRNSLSAGMLSELKVQVQQATDDAAICVVVIASDGKVFSSGHNLKELTRHRSDADEGAAFFKQTFAHCSDVMQRLAEHRCVTIAEVNGLASAAGCQLVASCNLAYASPKAGFCTPGVNIGLFCSTPMVALSRVVSQKHAMEMLLTGDVFDAQHAAKIGLINGVVAEHQLTQHVMSLAERIASKSQTAVAFGKNLFAHQAKLGLGNAYSEMTEVMTQNMLAESAREGIDAFLHKRPPKWP